jgi:hypothetical protein
VPDLHAHAFGDALEGRIEMLLSGGVDDGTPGPPPTNAEIMQKALQPGEFLATVSADTKACRMMMDTRAVKKTVSIPAWLNWKAAKANAPCSNTAGRACAVP